MYDVIIKCETTLLLDQIISISKYLADNKTQLAFNISINGHGTTNDV